MGRKGRERRGEDRKGNAFRWRCARAEHLLGKTMQNPLINTEKTSAAGLPRQLLW